MVTSSVRRGRLLHSGDGERLKQPPAHGKPNEERHAPTATTPQPAQLIDGRERMAVSFHAVALNRPTVLPACIMPSRLARTASPSSRTRTPRGLGADHGRRLREAQENLEHGGAAIMAMIYMGHLGVTHSRAALASEVREMEANGVRTG